MIIKGVAGLSLGEGNIVSSMGAKPYAEGKTPAKEHEKHVKEEKIHR